jgi:hypothetical protein
MAPNARGDHHLYDPVFHICNLDFGIFGSVQPLSAGFLLLPLPAHLREIQVVFPDKTSVLALMACMGALKSSL